MDKALFIAHIWVVRIFLLFLVVKWVMLLIGKKEALDNLRAKTKIVDMILGVAVLATGLIMVFRLPGGAQPYTWVKLGALLASIPLGIVGFKKHNAILVTLSVLLIAGAMGLAYSKPAALTKGAPQVEETVTANRPAQKNPMAEMVQKGRKLYYKRTCNTCHGDNGAAGYMGAKPLNASTLSDADMKTMILNGKTPMPANPDLSPEELNQLVAFVKSLKK